MNVTHFKVSHLNDACLGIATMRDKTVRYETDPKAYGWFEERPQEWLRDFKKIVRRLCRSCGHCGKFSIVEDEVTRIKVERI